MLIASADYARSRRRLQLAGTASTAFRYYQNLDEVAAVGHNAALGSDRPPAESRGACRSIKPARTLRPTCISCFQPGSTAAPGESIPVEPDYRIDDTESYLYKTRSTLAFGSERVARLTAIRRIQPHRLSAADRDTSRSHDSRGRRKGLTGCVTQRETIRRVPIPHPGSLGSAAPTNEHRVTMGVEYSRALSLKRRATFHFELHAERARSP